MVETPISAAQLKRLQTLWKLLAAQQDFDPHNREFRLLWVGGQIQRGLASFKDLTRQEAVLAIDAIQRCLPAHLVKKNQRRRGGREISHARGTAGRRGTAASKEIILPGAEDWAKLDAVMRAIDFNQERLAGFLRSPSSPLRGRAKIYSLADLNKVLWALEGIERRMKKQSLQSAKSVDALEEVAAK